MGLCLQPAGAYALQNNLCLLGVTAAAGLYRIGIQRLYPALEEESELLLFLG